jgi:CDP-4-dehydro-6-deoxyglucose reductase, E3
VSTLRFGETPVEIAPGQTVLAALEAAGIAIPSSCRSGLCQTCLIQAASGEIPAEAQQGLPEAMKAQGWLMPCICVPEGDLTLLPPGAVQPRLAVTVRAIEPLSPTVLRLLLEPETPFHYRSGQFLGLEAPDGTLRHYSIASQPEEDALIELHIRIHPDGKMSRYLADKVVPGSRLAISGPSGSCFYEGIEPGQPLVLAGTGTGLAPLWGILRDALRRGHHGPIRLYHGALDRLGLYFVDRLSDLAASRNNFSYLPCIRGESGPGGGDLAAAVLEAETQPEAAAFFLCGDPGLVQRLKRSLFLKGAKLDRLRVDAFAPATP